MTNAEMIATLTKALQHPGTVGCSDRVKEVIAALHSSPVGAEPPSLRDAIEALKVTDCWCDTGDGNPHTPACLQVQRVLLAAPLPAQAELAATSALPEKLEQLTTRASDILISTNDRYRTGVADGILEAVEAVERILAAPLDGVGRIAAERARQMAVEGWTSEHDDTHMDGEMLEAARCYVAAGFLASSGRSWVGSPPPTWPADWNQSWWKPSDDPIRNLEKAGALIAAEIDRLQRLATPSARPTPAAVPEKWHGCKAGGSVCARYQPTGVACAHDECDLASGVWSSAAVPTEEL